MNYMNASNQYSAVGCGPACATPYYGGAALAQPYAVAAPVAAPMTAYDGSYYTMDGVGQTAPASPSLMDSTKNFLGTETIPHVKNGYALGTAALLGLGWYGHRYLGWFGGKKRGRKG